MFPNKYFFHLKTDDLSKKMSGRIFYLTGLLDFLSRQNRCCRICEISLTSLPPPPWIIDLPAAQGGEFLWEFSTIGDISRHKSLFYRSQWYIFISSKDFHSAGKHFVDEESGVLFHSKICFCFHELFALAGSSGSSGSFGRQLIYVPGRGSVADSGLINSVYFS